MLSPSQPQPFSPAIYQHQRVDGLDTTKELTPEWQSLDLEALRDLHTRAINTAEHDHGRARMMFLDAMDGLESLVGATHCTTVEVLSSLVNFCLSHGFYNEANDRLQKSLADHEARFGDSHHLTLMSMARLGDFYSKREQRGDSEIMLVRAKHGLERLFWDDAEELLVNTLGICKNLAKLYQDQGEFEKSEQEYLLMIGRAEALQGPYVSELLRLKHALVLLYRGGRRVASGSVEKAVPLLRLEQLLLECIEACEYTSVPDSLDLEFLEYLRDQYDTQGENLKLQDLLVRIVYKVEAVEKVRALSEPSKLLQIKKGLARSNWKLGNCGVAEWWFLRLQPEIDTICGINSLEALANLVQTALFYLGQDKWDEAEPYFRDAQSRAEIMLEQDDPIKEKIARCLTTRIYKSECLGCML